MWQEKPSTALKILGKLWATCSWDSVPNTAWGDDSAPPAIYSLAGRDW